MAEDQVVGNTEAPHVAIIQVIYETYEQKPDGHYNPTKKTNGKLLFTLRGSTLSVCEAQLNTFIDIINREAQSATVESQGEGSSESQIPGASGTLSQPSKVLGMRSGFARHPGH